MELSTIEKQLDFTVSEITLPGVKKFSGKVRDCFLLGNKRVLVSTDRLSAFDRVLTTIPYKGQVVNQMALYWFNATAQIVPNHILETPHPNLMVTKEVHILPVEVVVRGYLAGSAWRDYQAGRAVSGIALPQGMQRSQRFEEPLLTPSTKAQKGEHDLPISSEEVVSSGLVEKRVWEEVSRLARELFYFGTKTARENGLILVDTKYEFGLTEKGEIILADEIHTPDSSRYWILESYREAFNNGIEPPMLDKEFVRSWLISQGYMGDGTPPEFTNEFRCEVSRKYIESFEQITGTDFMPKPGNATEEIIDVIKRYL